MKSKHVWEVIWTKLRFSSELLASQKRKREDGHAEEADGRVSLAGAGGRADGRRGRRDGGRRGDGRSGAGRVVADGRAGVAGAHHRCERGRPSGGVGAGAHAPQRALPPSRVPHFRHQATQLRPYSRTSPSPSCSPCY